MKKGNAIGLALLTGALVFQVNAEKVRFEELPAELQTKIRAHTGSAPVEDIDRNTKDGRTFYEVAFKKNGQHTELRLDEQGNPLNAAGTALAGSRKMKFTELPEAVRRTAETHLQGGAVNDVDRRVANGQVTYEIGFKRNNGAQQELLISEEGRVLRSNPRFGPGGSNVTPPTTASGGITSQTVQYGELPSAVRSAAEARLSNGHVSYVDRILNPSQTIYEIGFLRDNGKEEILLVAENGTVLDGRAVGRPGSTVFGRGTSLNNNGARVTLQAMQPVTQRGTLPFEVRNAIRRETRGANLDGIQRGTVDGRNVFQISFSENNQTHVVQLDERGNLIYDSRK